MARRSYPTDLTDSQWTLASRHFPAPRRSGRPRRTDLRAVIDAILYLLRTGCQWRMLPGDFMPWGTVWWYFRRWRLDGVWTRLHRALHRAARLKAGRRADPTVVIMDAQSVKTTRGGRGFDGYKRVKGRKRQILVDTQGFLVSCRVEPAGMSDRRAARGLTTGLSPLWPKVHTVIADAGYESKGLAQDLRERNGWRLAIVKRKEQAFRIAGLNWIVERSFAWLGRHRRMGDCKRTRRISSRPTIFQRPANASARPLDAAPAGRGDPSKSNSSWAKLDISVNGFGRPK